MTRTIVRGLAGLVLMVSAGISLSGCSHHEDPSNLRTMTRAQQVAALKKPIHYSNEQMRRFMAMNKNLPPGFKAPPPPPGYDVSTPAPSQPAAK